MEDIELLIETKIKDENHYLLIGKNKFPCYYEGFEESIDILKPKLTSTQLNKLLEKKLQISDKLLKKKLLSS